MNKKKLPFKRTQTDGLSLKLNSEVLIETGRLTLWPMRVQYVTWLDQWESWWSSHTRRWPQLAGGVQRSTVTTRHNHLCPSSLSLWPPQYWNIRNKFCSKIFFFGFNPARVAVVACPLSISLVLSAVYNLHIFMCFYSREYSTMFT